MITAGTRPFAVLGDPVSHSLSPRMHNAGFRAAGVDAVYLAIACTESDLPGIVRSLVASGGGGNVTIPHKGAAAAMGGGDDRVMKLGAANLFHASEGKPRLANTDVDGLLAVLDALGVPPGSSWLVAGTGGTARAVVGAATERGARIAVRSRDRDRGREFAAWAATLGVEAAQAEACQVAINCTPMGLGADDPAPLDLDTMPVVAWVVDCTYRDRDPSALVRDAEQLGLAHADGRELLLAQGVAGWPYWLPGVQPPVEVMRAALEGRMA
jgi:shikimate dehydrogenase